MSLRFGGGGGAPVADATTSTPGLVEVDVAPASAHPVALTKDGLPGVATDTYHGVILTLTSSNGGVTASHSSGTTILHPDQLVISRANDTRLAVDIHLAAGSAGAEMVMKNSLGVGVWEVDADGTELLTGAIGVNGQPDPGFPVLATGAGHTVDQVITLLQSIGLCKQS